MSQSTYSITVSCAFANKEVMLAHLKQQVEQVVRKDFSQEQECDDASSVCSSTTCSTSSSQLSTGEYTQSGNYTICYKDNLYTCTCPHYQYRCAAAGKHCKHITAHINNQ